MQFARQGGKIAAAVGDIHLWDTDPGRVIQRVCDNAGDGITEAEWAKNIPDIPYQPVWPPEVPIRGRAALCLATKIFDRAGRVLTSCDSTNMFVTNMFGIVVV